MAGVHAPRLTQLVSQTARVLTRRADEALAPLGLHYAQVPVLVLLRRGGAMTQKELAVAARVEQPSMAELLTRMQRDGLVTRSPNPRDARSRIIELAPDSGGRLDRAQQRLADLEDRALAGLDAAEAETLKVLMARVLANLDERA
jgi:MarR family transcriptional regulator for hemolysin